VHPLHSQTPLLSVRPGSFTGKPCESLRYSGYSNREPSGTDRTSQVTQPFGMMRPKGSFVELARTVYIYTVYDRFIW
jgi:hypothetical protein